MDLSIKVNRFGNIVTAFRFNKITYYSIEFEDEDDPLFLQFLKNHKGGKYAEPLAIIRKWLTKLGNEIGADERYFRPEAFRGGDARALPPPARFFEVEDENCPLRLYCMRVTRRAVILFNGGEKTAQTAQACDNVWPHFLLANKLTQVIDKAIQDGDIQFDDKDDLIFDEDLTLEL